MKKYLFAILALLGLLSLGTTLASDDEYEYDDDRYEYNYEYQNNYYEDDEDDKYEYKYEYQNTYYESKYISPNQLPEKIIEYVKSNYNATIIKAERKSYWYEIKLSNWVELKFDTNWNLMYKEEYKYKYQSSNSTSSSTNQNTYQKQYKYINSSIKEKVDNILETKLFSKIANLNNDQKLQVLNTVLERIEQKINEIKDKTTLTKIDEIKLELLDYLKYKINEYIEKMQVIDPESFLNEILGQ